MERLTNYYFTFAGISSSDMGIHLPSIAKRQLPVENFQKKTISGRSGFELVSDGSYGGIKVKQDIAIDDLTLLPDIRNWLRGRGELIFSDEPLYAYDAVIMTVPELTGAHKHLKGLKCTLTWDCQPFRHAVSETPILLTESRVFNGQGHVKSMPLMKVEGDGACVLTVNGRIIYITLETGTPLYLDNDAGIAYTEDDGELTFAGTLVSLDSDWFELLPYASSVSGYNNVSWTGNITRVTITPRWRWL